MMRMTLIRAWLFPADAARQEITVEGAHLCLMAGYAKKSSLNLIRLPVHIPECRSYTVEYRVSETGEFAVSRDEYGSIVARSGRDPRLRFPVCWLPPSFVGKRVDRYILMVDRKQVSYRAGAGYCRAA